MSANLVLGPSTGERLSSRRDGAIVLSFWDDP